MLYNEDPPTIDLPLKKFTMFCLCYECGLTQKIGLYKQKQALDITVVMLYLEKKNEDDEFGNFRGCVNEGNMEYHSLK